MLRGVRARSAAAAACMALVFASCGSGNATPTPKANDGTSFSQASLPASPAGFEQVVYYLAGDSGGTKPSAGSRIAMLFLPGGTAILYAVNGTDELAHHGTWSYSGGNLSLEFTSEDFKHRASFKVGPADKSVTMPFHAFDAKAGSSVWLRGSMSAVTKAVAVFDAAATDPDVTSTPDKALDQAFAAIKTMADSDVPDIDVGPTAGVDRAGQLAEVARQGAPDVVPAAAPAAEPEPPKIKEVTKLANGVHVEYEAAPAVDVVLYDWNGDPTTAAKITKGPIAGDPRVRINVEKPGNGQDDPVRKRAALIAPFASGRYYGTIWTEITPDAVVNFLGLEQGEQKPSRGFNWDKIGSKLSGIGYEVDRAMDSDASLTKIVQMLGGRSNTTPGVVIFNTHGLSNGDLATGSYLGKVSDPKGVEKAWNAAVAELEKTVPDLFTFEGGTPAAPKTITKMALPRDGAAGVSDYFLALTPAFWRWMASHSATFDKSLVYIAACSTDKSPDLRNAIHAKAYFAWTEPVNPMLAGAVAQYLVDDMSRPNHTSEEAFYNIFRVVSTQQQIYDYDTDFNQAVPNGFSKSTKFADHFHAYGWDGSNLVDYWHTGWLDRTMNPGTVWWLVFAARWDKHAPDGAKELVRCNDTFWKDGKRPNIGEVFCTGATAGDSPTADETGYATYQLTGKQLVAYSKTVVPRLTLADG